MNTILFIILSLIQQQNTIIQMNDKSIYDIQINALDGTSLDLNAYKGNKLIIINVASECGFTGQYAQMQELYESNKDRLTIIGVPCNDFGGQEPGNAHEIANFCTTTYKVTFPMTEKVRIISNPHPLYQWLISKEMNGIMDSEVKWNFHKFLVNEDGSLEASLPSGVTPLDEQILNWLNN
jgi:glutathione peroxidase